MEGIDLLVMAPHPDDELVIGGSILYQAVKAKLDVRVVFVTNGDYYPVMGTVRMREAIEALAVLGVSEQDVLFLGYGDQPKDRHIYNGRENEIVYSHAGKSITYGRSDMPEYAYKKSGVHRLYTRENYKQDIKSVLCEFLPKIIITTDWDDHVDHIAVSLMVDECMGEILKEKTNYYPLLLKAQAYTGRWEGKPDYYQRPNVTLNDNLTFGVERVHPLNRWEERICFAVPEECRTRLLKKNILYRASKKYVSQGADLKALQFVNTDVVYWRRDTESVTYSAQIKTSSGNGEYLNDFKCVDCSDIMGDYRNYDAGIWIPDKGDTERSAHIVFRRQVEIAAIHLFENPNEDHHITRMTIYLQDGEILWIGEPQRDGSCTKIELSKPRRTDQISIKIETVEGENAGITEIEVYEKRISPYVYPIPLKLYEEDPISDRREHIVACWLEKIYFGLLKMGRGRFWPNRWLLMAKYDKLSESDSKFRVWKEHIRFVIERLTLKIKRKGIENGTETSE